MAAAAVQCFSGCRRRPEMCWDGYNDYQWRWNDQQHCSLIFHSHLYHTTGQLHSGLSSHASVCSGKILD